MPKTIRVYKCPHCGDFTREDLQFHGALVCSECYTLSERSEVEVKEVTFIRFWGLKGLI